MKLALLLPGYIESPDYHHFVVIDQKLTSLGYTVVRVDACHLWETGDTQNYTVTNYLHQVEEIINSYQSSSPTEIVLIGHSLGAFIALLTANTCPQIMKVICLSLPNPSGQSDHKWINGFRVSKKDLPDKPSEYREFSVPISFVRDRDQYSLIESLKKYKNALIIMGEDDPSINEVESSVKELDLQHFVKTKGMPHDFRQSDDLCSQVTSEIEKFLEK